MNQMICQFLEPINLGSGEVPDWEFSQMECEYSTSTIQEVGTTLISEEGGNFYLSSKLTYGDVMIIFFLIVFLGTLVFKTIWNFVLYSVSKIRGKVY